MHGRGAAGIQGALLSTPLQVWYRLSWIDTRLAWNASDWGGITMTTFLTGSTGNEIWVPDLQPYNSDEPISATLDYTAVMGSADGSQFWSRPGKLELMCKFSGLVAFPYDTLTCGVEVGGWSWSGGFQGMSLLNGGYEFSDQETTAGSSYTEYSISGVTVELATYEYACCPNEPWPVATFQISLGRAASYYVNTLLWPYVALTVTRSPHPTLRAYIIALTLKHGIGHADAHHSALSMHRAYWSR